MIIEIPIFDGGLFTNIDAEDIPTNASSDTENFDIDVKGKIVKRKGLKSTATLTGDHLTQLFYWVDSNLTGGANWIGYESQSKEIVKYNKDFSNPVVLKTFSSNQPSDIKIIPMANSLRFANGHNQDVGFLQHIDREFFFGAHSFDNIKYDSASPTYPTTWELEHVETVTGKMATGVYYYKAVPVFDGVQEAQFQDQFIKTTTTANDKGNHFTLKVDEDDYNPRITGVNIYRHFNATDTIQPVYRLIKSINLATKSTSADTEAGHSNARIGNFVYVPNGGISQAVSDAFAWANQESSPLVYVTVGGQDTNLKGTGVSGSDSDHFTDNIIYLDQNIADVSNNSAWNGQISIKASRQNDQGGTDDYNSGGYALLGAYYGRDVVYDARTSGFWDWSVGEKNGWIQKIGSQNLSVLNSVKRAIQLNADSTTLGTNQTIGTMSNGYYYESLSGNIQKIHVIDTNGINDRTHPLTTTKNKVNYKHGAFVNGRFFAGNVNLDPDDDAEKHDDFIIFSQINQPDILPVTNFIQIKDTQGGEIMGMRRLNDNLVVLMERGVYQLFAPAGNPVNYSLREADANVGCIASNSIVEAGQYIFFAGADNIYMIGAGQSAIPVSTAVKDIYTASSNLSQTIGVYDPLKNRILFRFGSDGTKLYALDYLKISQGVESWNKLTFASAKSVDLLSIDADLKIYTTHNES
mgnify:CR=1 FL=1|tara:strand:+ start:892 stop:2967 length:2076 start_codon:yes stop_codon:yes gene_type:complete